MKPYFLVATLYLSLALLAALGSSLTGLSVVPWFNGLRWLRTHLVTLGLLAQVAFGLLPVLAATRTGRPRPATRWDIWLTLNAGFLILLVGIPPINATLIFAGGALIFAATALLLGQLAGLRRSGGKAAPAAGTPTAGHKFYVAALGYLLVGILVGTGLWLGWGPALQIRGDPKEIHVHTNLWGFTALLFAGLLVDLYPRLAGRSLARPRSTGAIFWLMALGALGLVAGPWLEVRLLTVAGLALHTLATIWLLVSVVRPLVGERGAWTPGMWHLASSYLWLLGPVLLAPMIVVRAPGFPVGEISGNGAPMLIFGWVLQFGYALTPYLFRRAFLPHETAPLGGNRFSLFTAHLGGVLLWGSLFSPAYQAPLNAAAFTLWVLASAPVLVELWGIVRAGLATIEREEPGGLLEDDTAAR